MTTTVSDSSKL